MVSSRESITASPLSKSPKAVDKKTNSIEEIKNGLKMEVKAFY